MIKLNTRSGLALFLAIGLLLIFVAPILGQPSSATSSDLSAPEARSSEGPVSVEAYVSHNQVAPGNEIYLAIKLSVEPGWHVNSNKPNEDFLIPTEVSLAEGSPFTPSEIVYPEAKQVKFAFSPDIPLSVFDNVVWLKGRLSVSPNAKSGPVDLPVQVISQACNDRSCVAPTTQSLTIPIEINTSLDRVEMRHKAIFESLGYAARIDSLQTAAATAGESVATSQVMPATIVQPIPTPAQEDQSFWSMLKNFKAENFVGKHGYILAFIAMYLLGLGLTLTPCVYPIIPITIGFFGSQASGKVSRQFSMAGVFGIGIAISYALVGTIAAFSGALMGAALQSPLVLVGLSLLCFVMGLNSFGVFEIPLPGWLSNLAGAGGSRRGLAGAALMGLTMGIAAAPCLAAFIVSLLAFVASKHDPVLGFTMFFILGLGLATPFIALGTFSGLISKVPRSGAWMVYAKKVMGALLFAAALYFLNPVLPKPLFHALVAIALVAAGLYFGFFEPTPAKTWKFRVTRIFFAVLFLGLAVWWELPSEGVTTGTATSGIAWQKYSDTAIAQAKADGKPVIIDFYADWCIPCKELDKYAFSDPKVIEASKGIVMLKADLTSGTSGESKKLISQFGIRGVPTVVFIRPDGTEEASLRINQLEKAETVLERFNSLLSASKLQAMPISTGTNN